MSEQNELIKVEQEQEQDEKPARDEGSLRSTFRKYRRFLFGALLGVGAACLFMWLGFWKTVFILAMASLGAFLFGVNNKLDWLKGLVNRLFPPRS